MTKNHIATFLRLSLLIALLAAMTLQPQSQAYAATAMTVTPITWNVIGLDSNNVNVGPNHFPIGARVCNTSTAGETLTNVKSAFVFDDGADPYTGNAYINLRAGTLSAYTSDGIDLAPGACTDFYYEAAVTRNSSAYDKTRNYHITASSNGGTVTGSTPRPRTLYVEHLVSQNRNAVTDVLYGTSIGTLASVAPGGTMTLMVGNTYYIRLVGFTATQGYEQLESFINIPNTIFQVVSVSTTYTADTSATVSSPNDKAYGDACIWENNPNSPNYRSCLSTGKVGGNITVTYQVKILQVPAAPLVNPAPLSTLIYDFSGSSYHYNADYGVSTRYANIVNASVIKAFSPKTINPSGTSTLTFTINNPGPAALTAVNFSDILPTSPAQMSIAATGITYTGCGTPSPASLTVGAVSVSFSNITVAGLGTCTIAVSVSASTNGTYNNSSNNLFINTNQDTGSFATDTLVVSSNPPAPSTCGTPATMATWTMPTAGQGSGGPPPPYTTKAADVATATASAALTAAGTQSIVAGGVTTNAWLINGAWSNVSGTPPGVATAPYFQLLVDSSNYGGVRISAQYDLEAPGDWAANNNNNIYIYSSTDGTNFSLVSTTPATKGSWQPAAIGTAATTGASTTWFRITASTRGNQATASVFLDNITISGCPRSVVPTLSKSFLTSPIARGGTSTLQFTFANPNASALTGVGFSDTLPVGLLIATPNGLAASCTTGTFTGGTTTAASGTRLISVSGGTLSANANCTISVDVLGNAAGGYTNISTPITSTETGPNTTGAGYGTSSLTVIAPPVISKSFTANPIFTGNTTSLTFSISNPNTATTLTGVNFTDTLPAGLTVADSSTPQCGGTLTTTAASGAVVLAGGSLAAGASCSFSVTVTGSTTGLKTNSVTVNSTNGGTGNTSTANVLVRDLTPGINLLKQVGPTASGPWTSFLGVTLPANVYYRLVVENVGDVPLSSVNVTDPTVSTAGCSWVDGDGTPLTAPFTLPVANANDDQVALCVLGPVAAVSGSNSNTATAAGTFGGTPVSDTSTATYGTTGLTLAKSVAETSFTSAGDTLNYSYLVTNSGFAPLLGPVTVTDDKATVTCPAVTTVGDNDNYLDPGESLTCTASYTVTAGDATAGFVTNTASASVSGVTSNTDTKTINQIKPDLTVTKANNVSGTVPQNGTFNWTITVTNSGTATASFADTNVIMSDLLPGAAGYYPQGALTVTNGATPPTGTINCSISGTALSCAASGAVTLPVGASFSVTFAVTPSSAGSLANTATVDPNGIVSESDETNNIGSDTVTVIAPPSISKSFGAATVNLGGTTTLGFTITNPNTGTALTGVAFTDVLPAGLTVADGTSSACGGTNNLTTTAATGTIALTGGTIAASGNCTFSVTVTGATVGVKNNTTGSVASTNGGTGNTASASTTVVAPDLTVTKTNNVSGTVPQNGTFNWTITVTNSGTATASFAGTNVIMNDPLPGVAGYYPQGALSVTNGATPPTGTINCSISGTALSCAASGAVSLPAGASFSVTFSVTPSSAGGLANIATVDPNGIVTENDETNNSGSNTVTVIAPPSITKSFSPNPVVAGTSSTLTFTISNSNGTALTGVGFTDTYPVGLANMTPVATSNTCGGTLTAADGGGSVALTGGTIAANSSCTITVTVVPATGGDYVNTTGNVTSTNGGPGNTATSTLNVFDAQPAKSIVTTSESFTGLVGGTERVAIGEMVRYRLATRIPEGSFTNVQLLDGIPTGLQFLNDSTATVAFVCNGGAACMTSSTLAGAGLVVNGSGSAVSPTFVMPGAAISGGPFGSGTDVTFSLGDVANSDADADSEYIVVEFNALVLNVNSAATINQGLDNQPGANGASNINNRQNDVTLRVNGSTIGSVSPNGTVAIAEPSITSMTKSVSPAAGPYLPGAALTYTLSFNNNAIGNNAATGFDIVLTDTFDSNLAIGAVNISSSQGATCAGSNTFSTNSSTVGQLVTVNVSCLDPGSSVTVTVNATVSGTVPSGTTISNSSGLTYTSLPGAQGNCATAPFTCTGVGTSGSGSGERNGSGGPGTDGAVLNNYAATSNTTNTTVAFGSITITKDSVPDNSQDFAFTGSGPNSYTFGGGFSLDNDADATLPNTRTFTPLPAGGYTVTEGAASGWTLTGLTCTDPDSGSTTDLGTATATIDLDSGENVSCTFTNTLQQPSILLTKTPTLDDTVVAPSGVVNVGDVVIYTFSVQNTGNVTLTGITVSDPLLPTLSCTIATLGPGATSSCTPTNNIYTLTQVDIDAGSRANTATVTGTPPSGSNVTDPDTQTTSLPSLPSIVLTKTPTLDDTVVVPSGVVNVGDTITYTFSVQNTGNVTLTGITVSDPLLPTLSCTVVSLSPGATSSCTPTNNSYTLTQADIDAGSRANTATVTGTPPSGPNVTDSDTQTTTLPSSPSIVLTKTPTLDDTVTAPSGVVDVGDTITYTFSVQNTGNVTLTGITVSDPLLPTLSCTIASLVPGATSSCTPTNNAYTLTQADIDAGSRANTATVTGTPPSGPNVTDLDTQTTTLPSAPSIVLTKTPTLDDAVTAPSGVVDVGDTITYTFSVQNTGNVTLTGITVSDPLLPTLSCTIASLAPGATSPCVPTNNVYILTQADIDAGSRANTAMVTGTPPSGPNVTSPDTQTTTLPSSPSIVLTKTAAPTTVTAAGDMITYIFSVENTGNVTLTNITLSDSLLAGLNCTTIASLAPNASQSFTCTGNTFTVSQADLDTNGGGDGDIDNTATATGTTPGGGTTSDTDSQAVTLPAQAPALTLAKTAAPTTVTAVGDVITYTFSVQNTGNVTLTNVTLSDSLLSGLNCTAIPSLAPNATQSFTCTGNTYTVTQADLDNNGGGDGDIDNTATATGTTPSGGTTSDTDSTAVTLPAQTPGLTLTKTANPTTVTAVGDVVTYTFSVQNTGNVTLTNVTLSDSLLTGLNCTAIASLAPNATQSFTCTGNTYTVTQADLDNNGGGDGDIDNTATATGTTPGGGTTSDTDSTAVSLPAQTPAVNIVKSPATQNIISGGTANFTLTVTNTGNVTLTGVTVTDAQCTTGPTFTGGDTNNDTQLQLTETWTYSCSIASVTANLTNTASVNTTQGATDTATADVTVAAQQVDLELAKSVSDASPLVATNITFTLTVTNVDPIPATNVVVTDVLPAGFTYVSDNSGGAYNSGTGVWTVGTVAANGSASLTITVSVNVTGPYTNYAEITGMDQVDPDSTPNNGSTTEDDDDSVMVAPTQNNPSLGKSVSNSNQAFTTGPNVAIGEIVEYTVTVNVPPGVFSNSQLVDTMERGLSFITCSGITPSDPALTTDVAGSFTQSCSTPTVDDAGGGTTVDVGRRVTFNLGTLTNASGSDQTLAFLYSAVVLDSASNVSGAMLDNSAAWTSDSGSLPPTSASVQILEPELSITKTASAGLVSVGGELTITLNIQHTGSSQTNAYDTILTDTLPAELELVPGTLECVSGAQDADSCAYNTGTRTISATWNNFALGGGNGRVTFRARVVSLPSGGISNTANVAWSSLPGNVSQPQNSNIFSTERDYDPASQIDVYVASDTLQIGVFGSTPATGFAPNVVTDLSRFQKEEYAQTGGLIVEIPSLRITIPIVGVPLKNGEWNVSWLGNQAGWLEGSAYPTWRGNSVLTSHVYGSNGLPGPFVNLGKLKYGDRIIVHAYGMKYTYEVRANAVVDPDETSIFRHEDRSWLTLVTCKEYDQKSDTYKKRVVVRAVLVSVGPK